MRFGRALVVAVVVGAAAGVLPVVRAGAMWALACAALSCAIALDSSRGRQAFLACAVAAAAGAHAAGACQFALAPPLARWFAARTAAPSNGPIREGGGDPLLLEGTLARDAELADDGGARLVVDVERVDGYDLPGRVQAHVAGSFVEPVLSQWTRGRRVRAPALLRWPQVWLNPGGPGLRWQTLRRPFDLLGSIKSASLVSVEPGRWWDEWGARVRGRVRRAVGRVFPAAQADSAAIVTAILIGDRAGLDEDIVRRLQAGGTYHVIAISGGNVALVTGLCVFVLRFVIRPFRAVSLVTMAAVTAYGWIVGGDPSVSRAALAACLYLALGLAGLAPAAVDVLGVVAAALVLIDPLTVVDVSAWLSFGATLGIIVIANRLVALVRADPLSPLSWRRRVLQAAMALLAATAAAELTLLPVSAGVFHRVGIAGLVLNFVAIPAMAVVQIAGAAAVALDAVWAAGARVAAWCAHLAATALIGSSQLVDAVPWLTWRTPPPASLTVAVFYGAGVATLLISHRTRRRIAAGVLVVAAAVMAWAPFTGLARPSPGWLRFTAVDVGQGDALLLQFPTGQSLLMDAGTASGAFDMGERVVAPALWALGERRLTWLGFSHPDLDHIGGAAADARIFDPREVWEGVPVPSDPKRRALRAVADAAGMVWRPLQRGDVFELGAVRVEVLNPPKPDWERPRTRNDDSLVLVVRYGAAELLLTGDIGADAERELPPDTDPRPLRILKVAHHGSRGSSSPAFVQAFDPQVAIVSVGRGNLFGHPAPEVIERLTAVRARVFRTDRDGAVSVETDGHEVRVRTATGATWTIRDWSGPA